MTAAGVQNIESAAYLPPPPSASTPDAKAGGTADKSDADFRSELEQQTGKQETKPASQTGAAPTGPTQTGATQTGTTQTGTTKTGSDKSGKKRDARRDDTNLSAVTPVQAGNPQKQILPFALALAQPQENAKPNETSHELVAQVPLQEQGSESEDQSTTSAKAGTSAETQPVLPDALELPATPPEPVSEAIQETADPAPGGPSALAFAARLESVPHKGNQAAPDNPSQPPADAAMKQDAGPKRDPGADTDRLIRADVQTTPRIDVVLPRLETAYEAAQSSGPAEPQQSAPSAHLERVFDVPLTEPPAAPPTSAHDIRVRVPDNNGGSTQVRFVESGGEVRVSVRTADESLAQSLRTHLNDLTQRLSDGGLPAEIWKPATNAASSQNDPRQSHQDGRGSGGQGSGGQSGQQDRQQKRPAWLEEMEASLHGPEN